VPWGLKRYHESRQTHFITFTCYHRRPRLDSASAKRTFELALERVRRCYHLRVYGYVVMPEHVHLLLSEPERSNLAEAVKSLKQDRWPGQRCDGGPFKPGFGLSGDFESCSDFRNESSSTAGFCPGLIQLRCVLGTQGLPSPGGYSEIFWGADRALTYPAMKLASPFRGTRKFAPTQHLAPTWFLGYRLCPIHENPSPRSGRQFHSPARECRVGIVEILPSPLQGTAGCCYESGNYRRDHH
jgi:Transposase IS200 like